MKRIAAFLLIASFFQVQFASAQSAHQYLREGDAQFEKGALPAAEESYRKAQAETPSAEGAYNLGNSIYLQERYDEAVQQYESAARTAEDPAARSYAYHNLGNAHYQNQQYDQAVEAYKNALRINPKDEETRENLLRALTKYRQQQQQQQQQ
ncbi:MAG: tetratricopeptide repeat protein, partial [Phaeodactylibacter sp.]|nr:tetratricopeptide repeat protein [Phaeodactylibacter sp.]